MYNNYSCCSIVKNMALSKDFNNFFEKMLRPNLAFVPLNPYLVYRSLFYDTLYDHEAHHTTLSHYIWNLESNNTPFSASWSIMKQAPTFYKKTMNCLLCLTKRPSYRLQTEVHPSAKENYW